MHVLRHAIEQLVSHYEVEKRVVENMTGNAPQQASAISNIVDDGLRTQTIDFCYWIGRSWIDGYRDSIRPNGNHQARGCP